MATTQKLNIALTPEMAGLASAWDAGIASGPGRFDDIEAIKAEARRRLAAAPDRR